jgi:hypothetical protein
MEHPVLLKKPYGNRNSRAKTERDSQNFELNAAQGGLFRERTSLDSFGHNVKAKGDPSGPRQALRRRQW